jgi:hypothetical protein
MVAGWWLNKNNTSVEETLLASNANIGGPATASAFAVAKGECGGEEHYKSPRVSSHAQGETGWRERGEWCAGWDQLVTPALLVGSLGQIMATFLGLSVGTLVLQHL